MATHLINLSKLFANLLGFFLLLSTWKKIRSFFVPLLTFSGIAVFLFPFTLFGKGGVGVSLLQIANILCLLAAVLLWAFPKLLPKFERSSLWYCLKFWILFFGICAILAILSIRWFYFSWDEYDNYNMVVNSLLKFGRKLPTVTHAEYPYGAALVEYYLCKVSDFNEHIMLFISGMIFFSSVLFTAGFSKRPLLRGAILCPLSIMIVYILGYSFYGFPTIMLDVMIGVTFAALICFVLHFPNQPKLSDWIQFIVLSAFFIQIKDVCAAFVLVAFLLLLIRRIRSVEKEKRIKGFFRTGLVCAISTVPYLLWFVYIKQNNIPRGHALGNITIGNLKFLFSGDNAYRYSLKLFFQHTFDLPLGTSGISIFGLFLILFAIVHLFQFLGGSKEKVLLSTVLFVGALAYTLYVGLVYIFVLDGKYPTTFDEYERFILSYLLGWTLPVLNFAFDGMDNSSHDLQWVYLRCVSLIAIFFFLSKAPYQDILHTKEQDPAWIQAKRFYQNKTKIFTDSENRRIFSLTKGIMPQTMLRSLFIGEEKIISDYSFDLDQSSMSSAELENYLLEKDANTLYVYRPDEEFWNNYSDLFVSIPENFGKYHVFERIDGSWCEIIEE